MSVNKSLGTLMEWGPVTRSVKNGLKKLGHDIIITECMRDGDGHGKSEKDGVLTDDTREA